KRIKTKPLKFSDSGIRKQAVAGRRKRLGKDFRHRRGSGQTSRRYEFTECSSQEAGHASGTDPDRRAALEWPPWVVSGPSPRCIGATGVAPKPVKNPNDRFRSVWPLPDLCRTRADPIGVGRIGSLDRAEGSPQSSLN